MALINCRICGKRISDTASTCIHCGATTKAPLTEKTLYTQPDPTIRQGESVSTSISFGSLDEEKQIELENEFLMSDKGAMKYRRRGVEMKKYATLGLWLIPIGRVLLLLQEMVIEAVFGGVIYNEQFIDASVYCAGGLILLWAFSVIMCIYTAFSYRSRIKKQLYNKKLQRWLCESKGISFVPNLASEKDRAVFEQINLDTMDF